MLVFPEEIAAVDDHAIPQMEQIHRDQRRLGVETEDIGVVSRSGGHLLALVDLFDGGEQIAEGRGFFETHFIGGFLNAVAQFVRQRAVLAFEKQPDLADRLRIRFRSREAFHARALAAMNVVLQARLGMIAAQVDLARRHQEMTMDEIHQPVGQVAGKVWAEVSRAVFDQTGGLHRLVEIARS